MKITEISQQKKQKNRLNVFVDGDFSFGIDELDAHSLKLKEGMELMEEDIKNIKETVVLSKAKDYSLSLVSMRFYTEKGIKRKLFEKGYDDETIDEVILFLKDYKYIDDFSYAQKYIEECLGLKKYGKMKIKMNLIEKGISSEIISQILNEYDFEEIERDILLQLLPKKIDGNFDFKNISKVKRYFISKGFEYNLIDSVIKMLKSDLYDDFSENL